MLITRRGLYQSPDGAPAGSGATPESAAATAPAAGGVAAPPAAGSGETGAAFDWMKVGLDTDSMALVNDRQWKGVPDVLTSYRSRGPILTAVLQFPVPAQLWLLPSIS